MDKVTRIAAWVFAGISMISLVTLLVTDVLYTFGGLPAFHPLGMVVPIDLLYFVILTGWIGFLMRGRWAWWLLIVSVSLSLPVSLIGIQFIFLGGSTIISIAELIFLLMNVPSADGRPVASSGESDEPGGLLRRTRVIAWIYIALSLYSTSFIVFLWSPHLRNPQSLTSLVLSVIQWPFWALLLNRRYWAWWVLVFNFGILICWAAWTMVSPHHQSLHHHLGNAIWGILSYLVLYVLPMWALLTDRPSRHVNRQLL